MVWPRGTLRLHRDSRHHSCLDYCVTVLHKTSNYSGQRCSDHDILVLLHGWLQLALELLARVLTTFSTDYLSYPIDNNSSCRHCQEIYFGLLLQGLARAPEVP